MSHGPGRRRLDTAWSLALAALAVAGAVTLAYTPAALVREYPGTTFALVLSFVPGGIVAEAVWNARPWRRTAMRAGTLAIALFTLAKHAEGFLHPHAAPFAPWPRVIRMLMLGLLLSRAVRLETRVTRPRPTSVP